MSDIAALLKFVLISAVILSLCVKIAVDSFDWISYIESRCEDIQNWCEKEMEETEEADS